MPKPLSIAIIGAGIGGLTAAATLRRVGIKVAIYEQARQFARIGAGIQMTPNPMKVLRAIGLEDRLRQVAFEPVSGINRDHDTGRLTNELPAGPAIEARYGAPYLCLHRADLHAALADAVPDEIVHRNHKLAGLETTGAAVTLNFTDGSQAQADAVIGADGVHSVVREILHGPESPHFTGRVAYRTTFPATLLGDLQLAPSRTKWWGPDRHIVIYYITRNRDEVYFVTSQPESAEWLTPESWSAKGDVAELRRAFADFHPEVRAVLAACPDVHKWALLARDPLPFWCSGRIALLGDACHPMTPYMAQGAASAIEDAAVLARCLDGVTVNGVAAAFKLYEAIRKPRATAIQQGSAKNNWMRTDTNPDWVYGYDAWTVPLEPASAA
jgi:salicylate hydroxylase/6-hydroxynicotinate 3-monooxygenase